MKLNNVAYDHSSVGFGEARRFGFEMNAMAFHAVIDGIYSDKIGSPVREYATNAYDAHIMAGTPDKPFVIMAPSTFNPYFMVRDFGPGMTHDEVMDRATTMFASNKRDTNDQVGMLGLGMKSAFAYTKQYTITCYDGAEQRDYVCFIDGDGAPTVTAMDPVSSTEPRGVKVSFPVQQGDIYRFQAAISKVMIGFDPMPQVLNDQWKPSRPTDTFVGSNFRIVKSDYIKQPHIRQGCVLYPLDLSQIDASATWEDKQLPIIIDVPIGTASVATSRESLGYDEITKGNLADIYQKVRWEIQDTLQTALDEPDNFLDACIRYRELSTSLGTAMVETPKWRGKHQLRSSFPYVYDYIRLAVLYAYEDLAWAPPRQPGRRAHHRDVPKLKPEELQQLTVVWEADDCKFAKDRLRMFRSKNPSVGVLWVKTEDLEDFTDVYGIETVVDLRDYDRLKLPSTKRPSRGLKKTDIRLFDKWRSLTDPPERAIYVQSEGTKYRVFDEVLDFDQVSAKYLNLARNCGLIDAPVIVLMKNQKSLVSDAWVSLEDVLKDGAKQFNLKRYTMQCEIQGFLGSDYLVSRLRDRMNQLPKRLKAFFDKVPTVDRLTTIDHNMAKLWMLITGKETGGYTIGLQQKFKAITERYPLLPIAAKDDVQLDHYLKLIAR